MNVRGIVTSIGLLIPFAIGCQSKLADENRALWQQNRELQAKVSAQQTPPQQDTAQLAALQSQLAERDQKLAELQNQLRTPTTASEASNPQIAGIETSYDKASGNMTVNVPGDVLFASGDATVRDEAKATLDKVVHSLKTTYTGKRVRIDGHTDNTPIRVSKWKSNQDLSVARADAVKAYLVKKGINPSLITTQGFGSAKPKAQDKSLNRRVEIVVATR